LPKAKVWQQSSRRRVMTGLVMEHQE
jgi:hypothetical protein